MISWKPNANQTDGTSWANHLRGSMHEPLFGRVRYYNHLEDSGRDRTTPEQQTRPFCPQAFAWRDRWWRGCS